MKTIIRMLPVLLVLPLVAHAGGGITIGLQTYHVANDEDLNERNVFIGISGDRYHCATFVNSYNRRSVACGAHVRYETTTFEVSLMGGAVYGYEPEKLKEDLPCADDMCAYVALGAAYRLTPDVALDVVLFGDAMMYGVQYMW